MKVINKFDASVWFLDYIQLRALELSDLQLEALKLSGDAGIESPRLYNLGLMYSSVENMLLESNSGA